MPFSGTVRNYLRLGLPLYLCLVISAALTHPPPAPAGYIGGRVHVITGNDNILVSHPHHASASSSYSESRPEWPTAQATAAARAQGSPGDYSWYLGVQASSSYANSFARAWWDDEVTVTAPVESVLLRFHYATTGSLHAQDHFHGGGAGNAFAEFSVNAGAFGGEASELRAGMNRHQTFGDDVYSSPGMDLDSDGTFAGRGFFDMELFLRQGADGRFSGSQTYQVMVSAIANAGWGTASVDSLHTVSLSGLTLADGTTPESAGYTVTFASGLLSPNLAPNPVPEPSSLALIGLGAASFVAWRRRRAVLAVALFCPLRGAGTSR